MSSIRPRVVVRMFTHMYTEDGGVLVGRQQLSENVHSAVFLPIVGNILRHFPGAQYNTSVAWRVMDALKAAKFSEWVGFRKSSSQEMFRSASKYPRKNGSRDTRYARVRQFCQLKVWKIVHLIQYEAFDTPVFQSSNQNSPPGSHYGRLEYIISVEFSRGFENVGLLEGVTVVFALFRQCILSGKDPRLDHLNIHSLGAGGVLPGE